MKPKEEVTRSFKLYPTTDHAAKYVCAGKGTFGFKMTDDMPIEMNLRKIHVYLSAAILKDSDYNEVDRAECQFSTTATVLENGSQVLASF